MYSNSYVQYFIAALSVAAILFCYRSFRAIPKFTVEELREEPSSSPNVDSAISWIYFFLLFWRIIAIFVLLGTLVFKAQLVLLLSWLHGVNLGFDTIAFIPCHLFYGVIFLSLLFGNINYLFLSMLIGGANFKNKRSTAKQLAKFTMQMRSVRRLGLKLEALNIEKAAQFYVRRSAKSSFFCWILLFVSYVAFVGFAPIYIVDEAAIRRVHGFTLAEENLGWAPVKLHLAKPLRTGKKYEPYLALKVGERFLALPSDSFCNYDSFNRLLHLLGKKTSLVCTGNSINEHLENVQSSIPFGECIKGRADMFQMIREACLNEAHSN